MPVGHYAAVAVVAPVVVAGAAAFVAAFAADVVDQCAFAVGLHFVAAPVGAVVAAVLLAVGLVEHYVADSAAEPVGYYVVAAGSAVVAEPAGYYAAAVDSAVAVLVVDFVAAEDFYRPHFFHLHLGFVPVAVLEVVPGFLFPG